MVAASDSVVVYRSDVEFLFKKIFFPNEKLLIGVVFKPLLVDDLNVIENILSDMAPRYSDIIPCGDFNENSHFTNLLHTFTTHFTNSSLILLDLFITNKVINIARSGQISVSGISAHDLILIAYRCQTNTMSILPIYRRNLNKIDVDNLLHDSSCMYCDDLRDLTDLDDVTEELTRRLKNRTSEIEIGFEFLKIGLPRVNRADLRVEIGYCSSKLYC